MVTKIITVVSVLSSLITIGVFIKEIALERSQPAMITEEIQNRELQPIESSLRRPHKAESRSRQPVAPEGKLLQQKDSTSMRDQEEPNPPIRNFGEARTYRLYNNEVLSLGDCGAKAEVTFQRLHDIGYARVTVIPSEGSPISHTIMGAGIGIRFKCRDHVEAVLSIVSFEEEQEFVDASLSTKLAGVTNR